MNSNNIKLLLSYYLDENFKMLFDPLGYDVLWAETSEETEKMIKDNHDIDIALEWQHGAEDYPIRDLLQKYKRSTKVILALNWNNEKPANLRNLGYFDAIDVPLDPDDFTEIIKKAIDLRWIKPWAYDRGR